MSDPKQPAKSPDPSPPSEGDEAPEQRVEHPRRLERPRRDQRDRALKPRRMNGGYDTKD